MASRRRRREERTVLAGTDIPGPGVHVVNAWLITGPDTMPPELREKRQWLGHFHQFTREGVIEHTREEWLAIPPPHRFIPLLKGLYHPSKLEAIHVGNPYYELLAKMPDFWPEASFG